MNPKRMLPLYLGVLVMLLFVVPSAPGATVTVNGTNTYPNDHQAVQAAIGLAGAGGTVILSGDFNFGANGGIDILLPNVTLMAGAGGASITGMGKPNATLGFPCLVYVTGVGCNISGLTITCTRTSGFSGGVAVLTTSAYTLDNPLIIENNTIKVYPPVPGQPPPVTGRGFAIWMRNNGCPMRILNNTLSGSYGAYVYPNTGDVLVSGNTITSRVYGIYLQQNAHDCIVTDNTVYGYKEGQSIHVCMTPGYGNVQILRNRAYGARTAVNFHDLGIQNQDVPAEIAENHLETPKDLPLGFFGFGIFGYLNSSPLNILNNTVRMIADQPGDNPTSSQMGLFLWSWDPRAGMDQENAPVLIKGNDIEIRYPMPDVPDYSIQAFGMLLGDGGWGVSNVTVEGNRLSGSVMDGITRLWYGKNTVIAGNDLSGLKTWEAQLRVVAGHTIVKDNILGFANHIPGFSWGVLLGSQALPPEYNYPMPSPTENCVLTGNDYRGTGLPGWSEGSGCILLQSLADAGLYGTEVRNNLVAEIGRFPVGTGGASKQVFENKTASGLVHDNRIVGLPADMIMDPGIGQRLKAVRDIGGSNSLTALENESGKKGMKCAEQEAEAQQAAAESPLPMLQEPAAAPAVPTQPELIGNYPNPFNPSTTIRFALPSKSPVKISIINSLGQEVVTLVQGEREAGFHEVRFDASNLPSGLYLCRMQTGSTIRTSKLLFVK